MNTMDDPHAAALCQVITFTAVSLGIYFVHKITYLLTYLQRKENRCVFGFLYVAENATLRHLLLPAVLRCGIKITP